MTALAAEASSGTTTTAMPAIRSRAAPPPGTKIGGSRQAITTRPMPLATIKSAHGTGRDALAAHGSSELYRLAPARSCGRSPCAAGQAELGQRYLLGMTGRVTLTGEPGRQHPAVGRDENSADGEGRS